MRQEYIEATRNFLCTQISCHSSEKCQYFDHNKLFKQEDQWTILNLVTNPPIKLLMTLDEHYAIKKMYFIMRELLANQDEQPMKGISLEIVDCLV